jgi:hypothetical protein
MSGQKAAMQGFSSVAGRWRPSAGVLADDSHAMSALAQHVGGSPISREVLVCSDASRYGPPA